eukprot:TRINITY_DN8654_c0_g1_i8.p3 TRINITY_DN8654_c0_g1~~TRINITY_DN8654_c0_g1_i8.p3  ORF type:complete len:162 (-),score=33.73 TRINITY_DN8654_c0_g1_i8:181-666(-)
MCIRDRLTTMGMKILNEATGTIVKEDNYGDKIFMTLLDEEQGRSYSTLITKMLSSLNVLGFRKYAVVLIDFFEVEVFGEMGGYDKWLAQGDDQYLASKQEECKPYLWGKRGDFHYWHTYSDHVDKRTLLQACAVGNADELANSVYFVEGQAMRSYFQRTKK